MEFIKNTANNRGIADAFVINSHAQKIIANTFLNFRTQPFQLNSLVLKKQRLNG